MLSPLSTPENCFHLNPSLPSQWNFPAGESNFVFPWGSSGDNCLAASKFYYTKRYSAFVFHQIDFPVLLCISQCICFSIPCLSAVLCWASCAGVRTMKQSWVLLSPEGTQMLQKLMEPRHENACIKILKISWALSVFQSLWSSRSNDALSWKASLLNNTRKVVHKNKIKVWGLLSSSSGTSTVQPIH